MHAFRQKHPYKGFYELAWEVKILAGDLPLGLEVLGSALRGMSKQEWKRILPRLKTRLDGKIKNIIKFSYDALSDEDKDLFLYLACLFIYKSTHIVEEVLVEKFPNVRHGLHVLAERSLISIDNGIIMMHTMLKQFGRETSRKQFVHHGLMKRQLLVDARDIHEVLSDDTIDSRHFIGLSLDLTDTKEELNRSEKALERMSDLQFIRIYSTGVAHPERLHSILQGLIYHSQKIRSLGWENFQNICLPSTFNSEFLVKLNMSFSKLEKLWEETKPLRNLKWMDLGFSKDLKELPDLSTATNLEELNLNFCSSLVELPFSIGKLTSLQILYLDGCPSLVKIPSSIENANNLQRLHLSKCSNLVELPSIGNATKLELPAIENATNLWILELNKCLSLVKLPSSIGDMTNLQYFDLSNCSSLVELPSSIGDLQKLCSLTMCGCSKLEALPTNINLKFLRTLDLTNGSQLKFFPEISTNIEDLNLIGTAIKEVPLSNWYHYPNFQIPYLSYMQTIVNPLRGWIVPLTVHISVSTSPNASN